ncbi:hypothetical protein BU25DRAFT_425082 [Macroventuria anomochaeta]|uniref:Uncharacterized protein n=1 Tax=Macroventuria anomochaeta TaxID=301207 RepID=A0ACB6RNM1_9PLEO|nr:uncharacterized protein BU25DRAFT_425082 [Macroventuria anomochaeta]KAF2623327.1 hypothetical protein BU25DRAFT_425082 [Macroventuria anomochaeta]
MLCMMQRWHSPCHKEDRHVFVGITDTYVFLVKQPRLDHCLYRVVKVSGSEFTYVTILVGLFVWAFLGIPYGTANTYKIIIPDAQAIISFVFDAFLMRKQFNQHDNLLIVAGSLRSRVSSHKCMIGHLVATRKFLKIDAIKFQTPLVRMVLTRFPQENRLTRRSSAISLFLGHIGTVLGFWCYIFTWL